MYKNTIYIYTYTYIYIHIGICKDLWYPAAVFGTIYAQDRKDKAPRYTEHLRPLCGDLLHKMGQKMSEFGDLTHMENHHFLQINHSINGPFPYIVLWYFTEGYACYALGAGQTQSPDAIGFRHPAYPGLALEALDQPEPTERGCFLIKSVGYPLVNIQKTMENCHL